MYKGHDQGLGGLLTKAHFFHKTFFAAASLSEANRQNLVKTGGPEIFMKWETPWEA